MDGAHPRRQVTGDLTPRRFEIDVDRVVDVADAPTRKQGDPSGRVEVVVVGLELLRLAAELQEEAVAEVDAHVLLHSGEAEGALVVDEEEVGASERIGLIDVSVTATIEPAAEGHRGERDPVEDSVPSEPPVRAAPGALHPPLRADECQVVTRVQDVGGEPMVRGELVLRFAEDIEVLRGELLVVIVVFGQLKEEVEIAATGLEEPLAALLGEGSPSQDGNVGDAQADRCACAAHRRGTAPHVEDAGELVAVLGAEASGNEVDPPDRLHIDDAEHTVEVLEMVRLVQLHPIEEVQELGVGATAHVESSRDVIDGDPRNRTQDPENVLSDLWHGLEVLAGQCLLLPDRGVAHNAEVPRRDDDFAELQSRRGQRDGHRDIGSADSERLLGDAVSETIDADRVPARRDRTECEASAGVREHLEPPFQDSYLRVGDGRVRLFFAHNTGDLHRHVLRVEGARRTEHHRHAERCPPEPYDRPAERPPPEPCQTPPTHALPPPGIESPRHSFLT